MPSFYPINVQQLAWVQVVMIPTNAEHLAIRKILREFCQFIARILPIAQ